MKLSCIWAMSENYVIGRDGNLPWRLSADLQRFKALTMGHHIVMGRKTWESIGRPLPGRTSIVLTRDPEYRAEGCLVVQSLDAALEAAAGDDEVFVVGGASIYALARRLFLESSLSRVLRACFPPRWSGHPNERTSTNPNHRCQSRKSCARCQRPLGLDRV